MHAHPVALRWKNPNGIDVLSAADKAFFSIPGLITGRKRCEDLIQQFLETGQLFQEEPVRVEDAVLPTEITIALKSVKVVYGADDRRPLTLLKLNGVALMLCRPDQEKAQGLLFKICPHLGVPFIKQDLFEDAVIRFNASAVVLKAA